MEINTKNRSVVFILKSHTYTTLVLKYIVAFSVSGGSFVFHEMYNIIRTKEC